MKRIENLSKWSKILLQWGVAIWIINKVLFMFIELDDIEKYALLLSYLLLIFGALFYFLAKNDELLAPAKTIKCIVYSEAHFKPGKNGLKSITMEFPFGIVPRRYDKIRIDNPYDEGDLILKITDVEYIYDAGKLQTLVITCI